MKLQLPMAGLQASGGLIGLKNTTVVFSLSCVVPGLGLAETPVGWLGGHVAVPCGYLWLPYMHRSWSG